MLEGKTALVTGSTGGIGLGIACALAARGANVLLNGRSAQAGTAIEKVGAYGTRCAYVSADMRSPVQIAGMMRFAASEMGRIDILVNNAGVQHVEPTETFPTEQWDTLIAVNLSAPFHTTRLALPAMQAANWGRIINIGSTHSLVASVNKPAYVAAKHGLLGLTKVVALETALTGITCNAICPGMVLTPLNQRQIDAYGAARNLPGEQAVREFLAAKQPSMQFTTPAQIGAVAVLMCSPEGDNIRGVAWQVDGGWTAQ